MEKNAKKTTKQIYIVTIVFLVETTKNCDKFVKSRKKNEEKQIIL